MIFQNSRYIYNPEKWNNGKFKTNKQKTNLITRKMAHPKHRKLEGKETDFKMVEILFPT